MNSDSETGSLVAVGDAFSVKIIDVPDLVNLIADFCDDESISKLSRVFSRDFILNRSTKT
jgi:hypothetical protein